MIKIATVIAATVMALSACGSTTATETPQASSSSPPTTGAMEPSNPVVVTPSSPPTPTAVSIATFNDLVCPYYSVVPDLRAIDPITDAKQVEAARDAAQDIYDQFAALELPAEHPEWAQSLELTEPSLFLAIRALNRWAAAAADGDKATRKYAADARKDWESLTENCPA